MNFWRGEGEVMAHLYMTSGRVREVKPANGKSFLLKELQKLVGGNVELVRTTSEGERMAINEEGKIFSLPLNIPATRLYIWGRKDVIVGDAVLLEKGEF